MITRISPLNMGMKPERTITHNGWQVPLTYLGERSRSELFVSDLSHIPKWCIQGSGLENEEPGGVKMPSKPGTVNVEQGILVVRLTHSEARMMVLKVDAPLFNKANYTDVTDAYASMAVVGRHCFDLISKFSAADLEGMATPTAVLAPVEDITCLMVSLRGPAGTPGIIISGARGYGHFLLDAVMDAGKEYGIQPAGLNRFNNWFKELLYESCRTESPTAQNT